MSHRLSQLISLFPRRTPKSTSKNFTFKTFSTASEKNASIRELEANQSQRSKSDPQYFLLAVPAAAFCLGCWQVRRREWKINLIREMSDKTTRTPIDLPEDLNELEFLEYNRVQVKGVFDHDNELFISPRQEVRQQESGDRGGMVSSSHGIGAHVITPLTITDGIHKGDRILINRGWVARTKMEPETRIEGQIEGEVDLLGILRHTDKGSFQSSNDKSSNVWQWRDLYGMAEKLNTTPVFLDAVYGSTVKGGPLGGQTRVTLRNEHVSYIITWYSLCFFTGLMWWLRFKRPPSHVKRPPKDRLGRPIPPQKVQ